MGCNFLTTWQGANYGKLSHFGSRMWNPGKSASAWAGETRQRFADYDSSAFEVDRLDNTAAAVWEVHGRGVVNDESVALKLRWILQTPDGKPGFNRDDTEWQLPLFAPHSILDPVPAPRLDT